MLEDVRLLPAQVALQRLLNMLQVKGGGGFALSSAIVPMFDVSALLQEETGVSLAVLSGADIFADRSGAPLAEAAFGATYTVPAGKSATIEHVYASMKRLTAAAPAGETLIFAVIDRVQPRTGHSTPYVFSLEAVLAGVSDLQKLHIAPRATMRAGDSFRARHSDLSTGGTTYMQWSALIIERPA